MTKPAARRCWLGLAAHVIPRWRSTHLDDVRGVVCENDFVDLDFDELPLSIDDGHGQLLFPPAQPARVWDERGDALPSCVLGALGGVLAVLPRVFHLATRAPARWKLTRQEMPASALA